MDRGGEHASPSPRTCPHHQVTLIPAPDPAWQDRLLVCPFRACGYNRLMPTKVRQPKLPGLDPGPQYRMLDLSERQIVDQALQWGRLKGYEILEINQEVRYPRCPGCRRAVREILCPRC